MNARPRVRCFTLAASLLALFPAPARADGPASAAPHADRTGDAEVHFKHGVVLYKEGDYTSALVEFQRANELAPNFRVLYNIGQTLFQMQRYAGALKAFESYLAQGEGQISPARRASVQSDLQQLRTRVGRIDVTVNVTGAEVRVDDEPVGTSPLDGPVLVSVGRRKVTVAKAGKLPLERQVSIAAGDRLTVPFEFPDDAAVAHADRPAAVVTPSASGADASHAGAASPPPAEPPPSGRSGLWIPWTVTGALAVGTGVLGGLALSAKADFTRQIGVYPGDAGAIDHARSRAKTYVMATDVLLSATALSGIIALYFTLTGGHSSSNHVELAVGPQGFFVRGAY